jgi:hypothetical protein
VFRLSSHHVYQAGTLSLRFQSCSFPSFCAPELDSRTVELYQALGVRIGTSEGCLLLGSPHLPERLLLEALEIFERS